MITLKLGNTHVQILGAGRVTMRALDKATSYKVAGARFVLAYKKGYWDGREHLLVHSVKNGYRVPIGLAEDLVVTLKAKGEKFTVQDARRPVGPRKALRWNAEIKPRDYQQRAKRSVLEDTKGAPLSGCGLLKLPIRSGKTKTAAMYIHELGLKTLVIVPSQMLLHQTVDSLRECFPDEIIGTIGDGQCDIQWITVATVQTLQRWRGTFDGAKSKAGDPRYVKLRWEVDTLIVDESHHLRGDSGWRKVIMDFGARHRLALSATAYLDSEVEQGRGIIWLKACLGPMRIDISESELIQAKWLMAQNIRLFKLDKPTRFENWKWSVTLQREAIWINPIRNKLITDIAKMFVRRGARTLIVANRKEQTSFLSEMLWDADVRHETVTGEDGRDERRDKVDDFVNGDLRLLVGTVLGEGVDIPEVEVVIIAAGGRDAKNTTQRMRNMTVAEGKSLALLIDFVDDINPYLLEHSMERLKVYKATPEFTVEVVG